MIGIRRTRDGYDVYAPHGFDDTAGLIVRPNPGPNFSAANYAAKAARWKKLWPEVTVLPVEGMYTVHSARRPMSGIVRRATRIRDLDMSQAPLRIAPA